MATLKPTVIYGTTTIKALTESASPSTGALVVDGGVGIAKKLQVGGTINELTFTSQANGFTISGGTASKTLSISGANKTINGSGTSLTINAPTTISSLTANHILYASAPNTISGKAFLSVSDGGTGVNTITSGGIIVGNGTGAIQTPGPTLNATTLTFGGAGTFKSTGALTLNPSTSTTTSKPFSITATNASNSTATGALTVSGGLGVNGATFLNTLSTVGNASVGGDLSVAGNFTVIGNSKKITTTDLYVKDKDIILGEVDEPTLDTADLGGIRLLYKKGPEEYKSILYAKSGDRWLSNIDFDLVFGKSFKIGNIPVLDATTLGSGVVYSSLTKVGTISTGVWEGTPIANDRIASPTISGVYLGDSLKTLTISTGLSGTSYNGSTATTIALADNYGDTKNPYASKTAKYFLAAPNGANGAPSFRAIVASDIPTLNQSTTGNANTASAVAITTEDASSSVERFVLFSSGATGNLSPRAKDDIKFNPFTKTLTVENIAGNASSATILKTARIINLTGGVAGSHSFDGSGNIDINTTVTDNSHAHISDNITDATSANTGSKIVKRDSAGSFSAGVVTANSFNATSKRELKCEIETFTKNATSLIKEIDVVSFCYKNDEKKSKHVGFIADDTNPIFSGEEQDHMDLANSVGVLLKAIQELEARITKLEKKSFFKKIIEFFKRKK